MDYWENLKVILSWDFSNMGEIMLTFCSFFILSPLMYYIPQFPLPPLFPVPPTLLPAPPDPLLLLSLQKRVAPPPKGKIRQKTWLKRMMYTWVLKPKQIQ